MANLLNRLISLIVCLAILAGGIYLSIEETKKNEELKADLDDVVNTEWIPGIENNSQEQQ